MARTPAKYCDLVMKGGITSGIVYPNAALALARDYRFKNIGGTSAGAIAAAACAAAAVGDRRKQMKAAIAQPEERVGFEGLAKASAESRLARVHQGPPPACGRRRPGIPLARHTRRQHRRSSQRRCASWKRRSHRPRRNAAAARGTRGSCLCCRGANRHDSRSFTGCDLRLSGRGGVRGTAHRSCPAPQSDGPLYRHGTGSARPPAKDGLDRLASRNPAGTVRQGFGPAPHLRRSLDGGALPRRTGLRPRRYPEDDHDWHIAPGAAQPAVRKRAFLVPAQGIRSAFSEGRRRLDGREGRGAGHRGG
ncbi:hypothetical protein HB772_14600 [Sinorhizobium meliloti]|nr:hypothetical protein HB772_14600 [Sinorhizobium meliloti]